MPKLGKLLPIVDGIVPEKELSNKDSESSIDKLEIVLKINP